MTVMTGEIIKEFILHVESQNQPINGRIVKYGRDNGLNYEWSISHHWQAHAGTAHYHPSGTSFSTCEDAEHMLKAYMAGFEKTHHIEPNEWY